MKRLFTLSTLLLAMSAGAQNLRLNLYGQYAFDDAIDSYYSSTSYYSGTIKGGLLWGGGLEYLVKPEYGIEVSYQRLDTEAPTYFWNYRANPPKEDYANFDLAAQYIMIGGFRYMKNNPKIEPYFGMQMGVVIANATRTQGATEVTQTEGSSTKFGWGLRGGVNIFPGGANSRAGLKLQAGLLSATQATGGGLYFGTGGAGAGISTYSTILQFTLGGGLTFKLGD
jgi:hypothetical protein